jgi:hypothetical protein
VATSENGTAEKGNTVLAFRLKRPEDLEEGYYTLGVVDPTAPDERTLLARLYHVVLITMRRALVPKPLR